MNEQELQQAFIQFLAQKTGAKSQQELEAVIQHLGEEGLRQAYAEFMQIMQQQQVQAAKFGAKLNYIKHLRGNCPEGYETQYFKSGGQLCKKCVAKQKEMKEGGELPNDPIDAFKCGRKMKKKANGRSFNQNEISLNKCGNKLKKKKIKKGQEGLDTEPEIETDESPDFDYRSQFGDHRGFTRYSSGYIKNGKPAGEFINERLVDDWGRHVGRHISDGDTTYFYSGYLHPNISYTDVKNVFNASNTSPERQAELKEYFYNALRNATPKPHGQQVRQSYGLKDDTEEVNSAFQRAQEERKTYTSKKKKQKAEIQSLINVERK